MLWFNAKREEIKADNPEAAFKDLAKIGGGLWKEMNAAARAPWDEMAKNDKERYAKEKAAYDAQQKAAAPTPDVGPVIPAKSLENECKGAEASLWRAKVRLIDSRYEGMRRVRGDGNCFYRAVLMGWMERLLTLPVNERSTVWTKLVPQVPPTPPARRRQLRHQRCCRRRRRC